MPIKLKAIVDKLDDVPEAYRDKYKQEGEKWILPEVEIPDVPDVAGLTKNRDELLREKKALEERYKGIDPEEFLKLKTAAEKAQDDELKGKGKVDDILNAWTERKNKSDKQYEDRIAELQGRLDAVTVDGVLRTSAGKAGVLPELVDDVVVLVKQRVQKGDNDNIQILDRPGGLPMDVSIDKFFSDVLKEQRPQYYAAQGNGGSGAPAGGAKGSSGSKAMKRADFMQLDPAAQMTYAKSGGAIVD